MDVNGVSVIDVLGDAGYLKVKTVASETNLASPATAQNERGVVLAPAEAVAVDADAAATSFSLTQLPMPPSGDFFMAHFVSPTEFYLQTEDCVVAGQALQAKIDNHVAASKSLAESGRKPDAGFEYVMT